MDLVWYQFALLPNEIENVENKSRNSYILQRCSLFPYVTRYSSDTGNTLEILAADTRVEFLASE